MIIESHAVIVLDGRHSLPLEGAEPGYLRPSRARLWPWQGLASYWPLEVDGERNEDAPWCYAHPSPLAARIEGRVALWQGVRVEEAA